MMVNKRWISLALAVCAMYALPVQAQEAASDEVVVQAEAPQRDPFQPYGAAAPAAVSIASTDEGVEARQTLVSYPLDSFRLIGIMRSPSMHLAVMQTRDLKDYIVTTGDKVGKEGGVVESIRKDGITVRIGDDIQDIAVSNKVEAVNDKKAN